MITVFCSNRPRDVLAHVRMLGHKVDEKDGIIHLPDLLVPVQIVRLGVVKGEDDLQYAPIKVFAKGAGQDDLKNLAAFRIHKIPDSDQEKVESYECIINLLRQKQLKFIKESINYLKEALDMSEEDIAKTFFPNALKDAQKEAKKSAWVDFMKVMLKEHRLNLDEAADSPSRPEFLTRNEAIELLTQKAS